MEEMNKNRTLADATTEQQTVGEAAEQNQQTMTVESESHDSIVEDLYITPHLDEGRLPALLRRAIGVSKRAHERDILMLSTLTACSYSVPHMKLLHGDTQHTYYANLMTLIVAGPASGKGVMNNVRYLLEPIERELEKDDRMVFLPANSSSAAIEELLAENGGQGMIMSSEMDEISKIWKQGYGNYSELLRMAAEHESKGRARMKPGGKVGGANSRCPKLSVLLSGTPGQLKPLLGSRENGLASRFQPYVVTDRTPFDPMVLANGDHYVEGGATQVFTELGDEWLGVWEWLGAQEHDCLWALTHEQEQVMMQIAGDIAHLLFDEAQMTDDGRRVGMPDSFDPVYRRLLVTVKRMGMIMSVMRLGEKLPEDGLPEVLYCADEDFATMLVLLEQLLRHSATMLMTLPDDEEVVLSNVAGGRKNSAEQSAKALLESLPKRFTRAEAEQIGKEKGLSLRTIVNYLNISCKKGYLRHPVKGTYVQQ